MEDIQELREKILVKMKDLDADFENYISSGLYLNDVIDESVVTTEWLIDKGMQIIEDKSNVIGISIDTNIYDNFTNIDKYLSIYELFQPKGFKELLSIFNEEQRTEFIHMILALDNQDDLINTILEWIYQKYTNEYYKDLKSFSENYITSNSTFRTYLIQLLNIIKVKIDDHDTKNTSLELSEEDQLKLQQWTKTLYLIHQNIIHILKHQVFNYQTEIHDIILKWLHALSNITFIDLAIWYISLSDLEQEDNHTIRQKLLLLKQEYYQFRKKTIGYPEYIEVSSIPEDIQKIVYKYISELDPFLDILDLKE